MSVWRSKEHWPARDYKCGDIVITIDGMIAKFISFKMDDMFATLEDIKTGETHIYHRMNFRLYKRPGVG